MFNDHTETTYKETYISDTLKAEIKLKLKGSLRDDNLYVP